MATTKTPSTRSRSTGTRSPSRKRTTTTTSRARTSTAKALSDDAVNAVKSIRTRATRAARKVPTDRTTLSIAAGVIAGVVAAGFAIFMNRDRLRTAAASGSEKIKKAADDLSTMAHERIDQARDNITKFRGRSNGTDQTASAESMAITG